ncbi:MAG: tRNA (guanosine(46)-N7)-methyltransferase TrmB [Rhodovibrionaceae bacterium]
MSRTTPPQARKVFGRRLGRPLKPSQERLIETLLPRLELDSSMPQLDPAAVFPEAGEIWLEIGFGGGEHLAWQATENPGVGFLGAEIFLNGIAGLLREIETQELANIRIWREDARLLLDALPQACLDRVFILFPDPWPKLRHHKRRIVQRETLDRLAQVMKPGAELRLATDDASYLPWMVERLSRHPAFRWLAERPADWRDRPADWPQTRYEAKALAAGRKPAYLRYRRRG